jgi:hypothetical protein
MSKRTDFANTPWYVLKSGNQPIHPTIKFNDSDTHCICVYGFSDKPIYDRFIKNTTQELTPYPLLKGFLSSQIDKADSVETEGVCLTLVILDATDPAQPGLFAANMATVLLAQQEKAKQVSIEYELVLDPETTGYQFPVVSPDVPPVDPLFLVK